ncbi:hypothetical protein Acsp04_10710 [Actinomadura sp. NBRC 104425]|uniref:MGH1-like glycoside hydrolase domain-containing protein n=1 Tax=Actinomadura sp. NBRC 104425 TaxID=3032204 RepID=UPI0024A0BD1C|nr:hypothetical protein [Actinomadura sp. NBRC 104425]GLZ10836.1 hypothetical protein Acsp04_10710 [Actinomadura sp. NBRC 104425]
MTFPATVRATRPEPLDAAGLRRAAARVLLANWTGSSTVPSRTLYPHQWSWDSAFIALGLRHLSPRRAQVELETLLGAQWDDGRLPHIVFDAATPADAYFPGPDFWRAGPSPKVRTSGIVQPPVHALAAWRVHRADPAEAARRGFLARAYPRLAAWHRYLGTCRDLGGHGLAAIVHPWESGMDNSPCWDGPLARVEPVPPSRFRRRDLDHAASADRPTDRDYGRYVRLARDYRDHGYDDAAAPHAFAVEDPAFNALLVLSELALARIAEAVGADPAPHRRRAEQVTAALLDRLWDAPSGLFLCRDLVGGGPIREHGVGGLVPLAVPGLPVAADLVRTAVGERFGLGRVHMVPSYDLTGHAFEPARYWRGPSWFNMSRLVHMGLLEHGETARADALRASMLNAAGRSDFAEYIDPLTGEGHGSTGFAWTAATVLDLLAGG